MGSRMKSHVYWIPLGRSNGLLVEVQFLTPPKSPSRPRTPFRDNDPPGGQGKAHFPSATTQKVSDSINAYDIRVSGEDETLPYPLM